MNSLLELFEEQVKEEKQILRHGALARQGIDILENFIGQVDKYMSKTEQTHETPNTTAIYVRSDSPHTLERNRVQSQIKFAKAALQLLLAFCDSHIEHSLRMEALAKY